ncbi:MAG: tyrosine--tRNA ligase [Candidatus Nanopelagicales bacterium]|nr:tyrosine--tRNA ligase [Candidatus Nanopelagicales bacterium]
MADIISDLKWRGLIADSTDIDRLRAELGSGSMCFYCGFDPTAPSLHLGNLLQILIMRRLQLAGHRPLALVGGATGLIGDPKDTGERSLNERDVVAGWAERVDAQLRQFLDFDGPAAARTVNNYEWTSSLGAVEFLREIGKHFSVNRMLDREAVAARLAGPGISFAEFSYQLLQANDFLELSRSYGCRLQTGGSDQWGNLTAGVDLVRRVTGDHVHAMTSPLMVKADGTKFGKTESGTVWLSADLTSPYAFYQFWVNADDDDAVAWLKAFSLRPRQEIEDLAAEVAERPQRREAQRALAEELTTLVHGGDATRAVVAASQALFGRGDLTELSPDVLDAALTEAPHVRLAAGDAGESGLRFVDAMARSGLVPGISAARRAVAEGGAYLNNVRVTDAERIVSAEDLVHGRWLVVRRGRRSFAGVDASEALRNRAADVE